MDALKRHIKNNKKHNSNQIDTIINNKYNKIKTNYNILINKIYKAIIYFIIIQN